MEFTTLLGIAFILICVLFIILLATTIKVNSLHKKVADVDPNDLYPFMEELRELVLESERVADKLEDSIRQKEEALEDLAALIDDKLKRLETIDDNPAPQTAPRPAASLYKPQAEEGPALDLAEEAERGEDVYEPGAGLSMRERISDLVAVGLSDTEIASSLGISITEVQIVRKMEMG